MTEVTVQWNISKAVAVGRSTLRKQSVRREREVTEVTVQVECYQGCGCWQVHPEEAVSTEREKGKGVGVGGET